MSKGSRQRPCNKKVFDENHERIFEKNQDKFTLDEIFRIFKLPKKFIGQSFKKDALTTLSPEFQILTEQEEKERKNREKQYLI